MSQRHLLVDDRNDWPGVAGNGVKDAGRAVSAGDPVSGPQAIRATRAGSWHAPGTMLQSLLLTSALVFAGFAGFLDPPKASAAQALTASQIYSHFCILSSGVPSLGGIN